MHLVVDSNKTPFEANLHVFIQTKSLSFQIGTPDGLASERFWNMYLFQGSSTLVEHSVGDRGIIGFRHLAQTFSNA